MRKLFYFLVALPLVFAACEEEPEEVNNIKEPVLMLTSEATMEVTAEVGNYEITYTLENKREGVELTAECTAEWVTVAAGEKVTFSVEANEGEARETKITVKYDTQSFDVTVKQAAKPANEGGNENEDNGTEDDGNKDEDDKDDGNEEAKDPVLTLTSKALVEFEAAGGKGEITYTLENPVEGVEVVAASEATWVADFAYAEGKVTFNIAANEGEARETKIVVAYGEKAKFEVEVKQAAKEQGNDPEKPEPEVISVELSNLLVLDTQSTTAEFSITVKNMNQLYYYLAPTAESTELTADEMLAQGSAVLLLDENTSWEAEQVIPFNASALSPATDYTLQVMGFNEDSHALLMTTFTTSNAEATIEKIDFDATSASIRYDDPNDKRNGYLTFRNDSYEVTIHLQSDELAGFYKPGSTTHSYIAEGSLFKKLNVDGRTLTYEYLDATFGSIDLYENVVTGKWEVYASLFFLETISIELDYIGAIEGAEREEAKRYVLTLEDAIVKSNGTQWNVTLWQDKNNTIDLTVEVGQALDHIPSGSYTSANGGIILESSTMIVDNVRSAIAPADVAVSTFNVEYNESTGESYISAEIYTVLGTAAAVIERCGPYKFYEAEEVSIETIAENNPLIWVTHDGDDRWIVEWSGNSSYGCLAFVTGNNSLDYIPAGRYYLRSTAPAEGGWIDCTDSNTSIVISRKNYQPLVDSDTCYLEITTQMANGVDSNSIKGAVYTSDGKYKITIDFAGAFDYYVE